MCSPRKRSPCLLLDPAAVDEKGWPLEKCAFRFLQAALHLCLFWWAIDSCELTEILKLKKPCKTADDNTKKQYKEDVKAIKDRFNRRRVWWVVGWLGLLFAFWLINPSCTLLKWIFLGFATLRLFEITITGLGTILEQEQQVGARNLTTLAAYFFHVVFIFAIVYHCVPGANFTVDLGPKHLPSAGSPGDYLYASLAYVTSLEGNYKPKGDVSEFLTVLTTTFSIFLFTVLIAFGIDEIKKKRNEDNDQVGEGSPASK